MEGEAPCTPERAKRAEARTTLLSAVRSEGNLGLEAKEDIRRHTQHAMQHLDL
jgi:hypothetical protein